jgi:MFS family permease
VERKAVASGGYAVVALGHASFALAHAWPLVAVSRAVSWIARGGKNPSRDSLLAGSVERADLGKAIGLERSMDSVGAVIGPLLAAPVLSATRVVRQHSPGKAQRCHTRLGCAGRNL